MADFGASSGADAPGYHFEWLLLFDDTADTVTVTAVHTRRDGSPAPAPQQAGLTLQINSGQAISLNLLTGQLTPGGLFDGTAGNMLNTGPRTRTNVRLRVSANRAAMIDHSTQYQPPA